MVRSRQSLGKVKFRLDQGQGKVKASSKHGQCKIRTRTEQGQGTAEERSSRHSQEKSGNGQSKVESRLW